MGLKLYVKDSSPPCHSVLMVIEALKLKDVELVKVDLAKGEHRTEEYLKMNPQHTIPTLKDGDYILWDSHAIVTYLVSQYADNDTLYPKDPKKRGIVDQRLHFNNAVLFNTHRDAMVPVLYQNEKTFRPELVAKIRECYDFIEKFFNGPWLAGDEITLADICASSTVTCMAYILPIDEKTYPNLTTWLGRISKKDFFTKVKLPGLEAFKELFTSRNIVFNEPKFLVNEAEN